MRAARAVVVLLLALAHALPARAQAPSARENPSAAWARLRAAWDPAVDDPALLAGLAGAASGLGDLPRFHALLDSVVARDAAGPNALRYWGAVGLQLGVEPDSVARRFARSISPDTGAVEVGEMIRVLEAFEAEGAALSLLDRAAAAGVPAERLALVRGQIEARAGEREAAIESWLLAIGAGGDEGVAAAARIGDLAADGAGQPPRTVTRLESLRETAPDAAMAGAIATLIVRLHAAEGRWDEALAAAEDPALGPEVRAAALRGVAAIARAAGLPEAAREALVRLVALGPPVALPEDRLALGEVEDELGQSAAAAESFEAARLAGATGALSRELTARVQAARESGDPERIARAVDEVLAAGGAPAVIAVPRGDLLLARARADSALASYAEAVGEGPVGAAGLEALARLRLAQALLRAATPRPVLGEIGDALVRAPTDPAGASERLSALAERVGAADSLGVARSLVLGLAAEWQGRAGDPAGASAALEAAALAARARGEVPALLLDAGRWALNAGDLERARRLWRTVAQEHESTPYALDARRRLAEES